MTPCSGGRRSVKGARSCGEGEVGDGVHAEQRALSCPQSLRPGGGNHRGVVGAKPWRRDVETNPVLGGLGGERSAERAVGGDTAGENDALGTEVERRPQRPAYQQL